MSFLVSPLRNAGRSFLQTLQNKSHMFCVSPSIINSSMNKRNKSDDSHDGNEVSSYKAYTEFETPSPFKPHAPSHKFGYKYKYYKGGLLPRHEKLADKRYKALPIDDPRKRDQWTRKKALFGQNDYIDILGDGYLHPSDLIKAPPHLKAYKGNEFQRILRRFAFEGEYLKAVKPSTYHSLRKQTGFLFKKLNRKRYHSNYWSRGGRGRGRLFVLQR